MQNTTATLKKEVDNNAYKASEALAKRHKELLDKQNFFEKETNQSFKLLSGEIEKLKYELSDTIDARFEHITKNIEG